MNFNRFLLYLSALALLGFYTSCADETSQDPEDRFKIEVRSDSTAAYHPDCKSQDENCSVIRYETLEIFTDSGEKLEKLTKSINDEIVELISIHISEKPSTDMNNLKKLFFESWTLSYREVDPDYAFAWEIVAEEKHEIIGDSIIVFALDSYSYTGGAHGNSYTKYLNYDIRNQMLIDPLETVNSEKFTEAAEAIFRRSVGLSKEDDLGEAGYFFDNDAFHLPHEIGLTEDGRILYYNTYEIRSYAEGPLELLVPYGAVEE